MKDAEFVARLVVEGDKGALEALSERFASKGNALGLEVSGRIEGYWLDCVWRWDEGATPPVVKDVLSVLSDPVEGGFEAEFTVLLVDLLSAAKLAKGSEFALGTLALLCLEKSETVCSLELFDAWFDAVKGRCDAGVGLPYMLDVLNGFREEASQAGPILALSAMEALRKTLPGWAPAHAALPDTGALLSALDSLPKDFLDGSTLHKSELGFDWFMAEARSCLAWLEGLVLDGGKDDEELVFAECAGSDDDVLEFQSRLFDAARAMGCSVERVVREGRTVCRVLGRTWSVVERVLSNFVLGLGQGGERPWPLGLSFMGDLVLASGGVSTGMARFVKEIGKANPTTVLMIQGESYPRTMIVDDWMLAISGRIDRARGEKLLERLALKIPGVNAIERVFLLHALSHLMDKVSGPSTEALKGLHPASALLPERMPEFTVVGLGGLTEGKVWKEAERAAATLEKMELSGCAKEPAKPGGRRRAMAAKADD